LLENAKEVAAEAYIAESEPKLLVLGAKNFRVEAQNSLLKIIEERKKNRIINTAPFIIFVILVIAVSVCVDGFFTYNNFISILYQIATPLVLSVGLTFVIILGSIDLSVEGVMGFVGSFIAMLVMNSKNSMNLGLLGVAKGMCVGSLEGT